MIDKTKYDLGEDADEQLKAWAAERQREYELGALLDRELGLEEPEVGNGLHAAACADLRLREILPDTASQEQLLAAYRRVSR